MKYALLLSDADNTLFDFHTGERNALVAVLEWAGIPPEEDTLRLYSRINESHWKKLERGETTQERLRVERFRDFLEAMNTQGDPVALCSRFVRELAQQRVLLPGADALCRAVSRVMPIYLVTNGLSAVQRSRFTDSTLSSSIQGFLISEEVGHAKPEPHMLLEAMRLAGVNDPSRVILLGDSVTADIAAAQNAGVDSVLFTNGGPVPEGHGATYTAKTLAEAGELILQE